MASSGMLRRVALVRTDVSEELSASFIRVTGIGELGTTLAVTSNRRTHRAWVADSIYLPVSFIAGGCFLHPLRADAPCNGKGPPKEVYSVAIFHNK
jgi:hypothetical protein